MSYLKPVTLLLIFANAAVFYLQQGASDSLVLSFGLWPVESGHFQPGQVLTYSFLHASLTHLAVNMLAILMFGSDVEHELGSWRFALYYLGCVAAAALVQLAVAIILGNIDRSTLGASGGVFGVLIGFGMLFPRQKLVPLILPIPVPAWLFVGFYGVLELGLGIVETQDGVAHFAHLGGMLGGWLLMRYWLPKRRAAR
jgi:membrane associated rhomboid family serine protease